MISQFYKKVMAWFKDRSIGQLAALSICVSLLAVVVVAGIHYKAPIKAALASDATSSQEPYSELYFTNFKTVQHYLKNNESTPYSFAVANQTAKSVNYKYSVVLAHGSQTALLSQGYMQIDAGQKMLRTINITSVEPNQQYQLTVRLIDQNQEINLRLQS